MSLFMPAPLPPSRKPALPLLLNPAALPRSFPRPPAPSMHAQQQQQQQRPPMPPHQYSSSSITSSSSLSSSSFPPDDASSRSSASPTSTARSATTPGSKSASAQQNAMNSKRRFNCSSCGKDFSTSGHLARHIRVHTGERNHPCPYVGCNARCSRQDNLVQHFRVHMPREERRANSTAVRAALAKCVQQAALSGNGNGTQTPHAPTPTPTSHAHAHPNQHTHHHHSPPSPPSRSPSPLDSVPLTSPGFDASPADPSPTSPGQWSGPYQGSAPAQSQSQGGGYNSYVRARSPPRAQHPQLQLPLPPPPNPTQFAYPPLPMTHPHPSYHPQHSSSHSQPQSYYAPPPLSPSSGSTLASTSSAGHSGSPLTPGWHPQQHAGGIRIAGQGRGMVSAPAEVGGQGMGGEWPWGFGAGGWEGDKRG